MVLFSLLLSACDEVQGLFETPEELPSVVEQIPEEEIAAHWEEVRDPAPEDKGQQGSFIADTGAQEANEEEILPEDPGLAEAGPEEDGQEQAGTQETSAEDASSEEAAAQYTQRTGSQDYSAQHGYYYGFLKQNEAAAYDDILYAFENRSGLVAFSSKITESGFTNVWDALRYDHPEYCWLRNCKMMYSNSTGEIVRADFEFPSDAASILSRLNAVADSITAQIAGLSDRDKLKYIYDWLITNTSYGTIDGKTEHTAEGALLNHRAVCAGYADAFKLLCDKAGISCVTVVGDALNEDGSVRGRHAWNQVHTGASAYWVDVTWGDPQFGSDSQWDPDRANYDYLCEADDPFLRNHRIDGTLGRGTGDGHFTASYPGCSDISLDDYVMRGCCFNTAADAQTYVMTCFVSGIKYISIKMTSDAEYQQLISNLFENGGIEQLMSVSGLTSFEGHYFTNQMQRTLNIEYQ